MTETQAPTQPFVRLAPVCAAWALVGLIDGLFGAALADAPGFVGALTACLISAGLWALFGVAVWLLLVVASHLVGVDALRSWFEAGRRGLRSALDDGDAASDRALIAKSLSWAMGAAVWFALGAAALAYLIATRHGPWLIAITSAIVHLVLLPAAIIAGAALGRLAHGILDSLAKREPFDQLFRVRRALGLAMALMALLVVAAIPTFWSLLVATDALAFALPFLALALTPLAHGRIAGAGGLARAALMVVLAAGVTLAGLQSTSGRTVTARETPTSKYVLQRLQALSDLDGDGSPSPPFGDDCAPQDPSIRPFAPDPPGDGIDQDCDGADGSAAGLAGGDVLKPVERPAPLGRKGPRPHLVLITIDALRADHLGAYGYARPVSPAFDRYAKGGVLFEEAFAQDSGTGPSLWSLMVGKTPFQVALERADVFPPQYATSETTLATRLQRAGYATAAVLCGQVFGTPGWNLRDGFDTFTELCGSKDRHQAARVTRRAIDTWRELSADKPTALWVHYYDPHGPYFNNPKADFGTSKIDRYDEEIAYTDEHLGPLLDELTKGGDRATYVAITADHGEGFGEHGPDPHARTLYREVTRVPLLFLGPDVTPRRVSEAVGMHDIAPTFLDLAGIAIPEEMTAWSLGRVLMGEPPIGERHVFQENSYSRPRRDAKGVIRGRHHYILDVTNGTRELYDMVNDPGETKNLAGTGLPEEAALEAALRAFLPTTRVPENLSK